ncbi:efflux RND transporter permease subunit [Thermincola ferriacetica]
MNLAEFSIRHKYSIFAFIIAVLLFGIYASKTLKMELFPDTSPPLVNVITAYPGVSAKDVAKDVSKPMEEEFATVEGVKKIKSTSQDGLSIIKVEFHYGRDVDVAAVDIQNAINRIKRQLPEGIQEPQVMKFSSSSKPVITYAIQSQKVSLATVRDLAENEIKTALQAVNGVAAVDVFGGYKGQVNVLVDKRKLDALNIPLDRVTGAISGQNASAPGGRITGQDQEFLIRLVQEYANPEELLNTVIDNKNGNLIYLKDVASVDASGEERRSEYRFNGKAAIALQVIKREDANTVEVIDLVKEKVRELEKSYPYLEIKVADDDSVFTKQVVGNMTGSVRDAIILTTLIIMISIVSLSESVIVSLSMPISFLATLALMKISGMELNLITLSGLILAVGIVVDDSIIVLENIMRHHHEFKKDLKTAAIEGTKEIFLADMAGTSTHAIVLVPLLFIEGFVGKVFGPLSLTLIYALGVSLIVSLTVIPLFTVLIGGRSWPRLQKVITKLASPYTSFMDGLRDFYTGILSGALKQRWLSIALTFVLFVLGMQLLRTIGMEVLPKIDAGTFFVSLQTSPGTSLTKTSEIVQQVEKIISSEKEVQYYSTQIGYEPGSHFLGDTGALGVTQANITVNLSTRKERKETIWQIEDRIRKKISAIPGVETFVVKESGGTAISTTAAPIDIRITGQDPEIIYRLADQVQSRVSRVPGAVNLYKSWSLNSPEIHVRVNEKRAAELGLAPTEVIKQVFAGLEGSPASEIKSDNRKDTRILVRYRPEDRTSLDNLTSVTLSTSIGARVPLRDVAEIGISRGANVVTRENLQPTIDILGYTYGRTFSHVTDDISNELARIPVPDGYSITITGEQTDLQESMRDLLYSLALAILAVYLLLVSQFRSFIHPVTIMVAVPLVIIGVSLALLFTNKVVSMSVMLGLILLVGTVVNNSIMLIDFIIRARKDGKPRFEAIVESVRVRFRPIMMTAMSQLAGMLPLATGMALGSERFAPLATAVIGGILTATLLTMVIVPVVYTIFDDAASLFGKGRVDSSLEGIFPS